MKAPQKIGLLDWGIGGLGVYKELRKKMPGVACIYFSDAGFTPYGKVPAKKLAQRLNQIADFFRQQNISTIVIACNAASTVIVEVQKKNSDLQFFGMLTAGQDLILNNKKKSVLVLGGQRTIQSGFFQGAFKNSKYDIETLVAQPLSALIEEGKHTSKTFTHVLNGLIEDSTADAVLLACTHYPAATSAFKKKFKGALILDPAQQVVQNLKNAVKSLRKGPSQFYTTGSVAQSRSSAYKAFRLKISSFKKVKLK